MTSYPCAIVPAMLRTVTFVDSEAHARLLGLMAVLGLPPVRCIDGTTKKPLVEVEVCPGEWRPVETVYVDGGAVELAFGKNGSSRVYRFDASDCPSWRMPSRKVGR